MSSAWKHKIENVWYSIKYCQHEKKEESIIHNEKKNLSTKMLQEMPQVTELAVKDIKILSPTDLGS